MAWTPRALRALATGLVALLIVVGYWWWQGRARPVLTVPESSPASGAASESIPIPGPLPTVGEVVVHVAGKVRRPGVITLAVGARVIDAVEAAGGVRAGATYGDLNLARLLVDGEQIIVGRPAGAPAAAPGVPPSGAEGATTVDINAATASDLETLPGIGPVLAQRIVQWRTDNGPFPAVDILGEVAGIGDVLLEQLRPLVRV